MMKYIQLNVFSTLQYLVRSKSFHSVHGQNRLSESIHLSNRLIEITSSHVLNTYLNAVNDCFGLNQMLRCTPYTSRVTPKQSSYGEM